MELEIQDIETMRKALDRLEELKSVARAMRDWIDAVPDGTPLPTMPGFDRDWADQIIDS